MPLPCLMFSVASSCPQENVQAIVDWMLHASPSLPTMAYLPTAAILLVSPFGSVAETAHSEFLSSILFWYSGQVSCFRACFYHHLSGSEAKIILTESLIVSFTF